MWIGISDKQQHRFQRNQRKQEKHLFQKNRLRKQTPQPIFHSEQGYVLIELLIAIGMIITLSAVVGFEWCRIVQQEALDQYARQIKTDLIFAEDEAIRLHDGTFVQLERVRPNYKVMSQGIYVRNRQAPPFIRFKWNTLPFLSNYIAYDSHGRTTTGGQLILTDSFGDIRDVILYMQSGQIRILPYIDQKTN